MTAAVDSRRAWRMVAVAFTSTFATFGVAYSFGAFFRPMAEEFGAGRAATSAVFSITAFLYFGLGLVTGPAVDRFGPRPVLLTGAVAIGAGLLLTSRVHSLGLGYVTYGVGVGVAVACGYVPMVAVVGGWFERRRSLALGLAVAGIGAGTLVVAPLAARLIARYGWRTTYAVFAVGSAGLLTVCALVAERPPRPIGPAGEGRPVLATRPFATLYVSALMMAVALFVPLVFLVPFAEDRGVGKVAASTLVGVLGGSSVAGRLLLGAVGDRLGRTRTYKLSFVVMTVSYVVWLAGDSYPVLVAYAIAMGVGYGGFIALSPAVAAELFGTLALGRTIGVLYTSAAIGALVGPPLAGALVDITGTYQWTIAAAMVMAAGATAVLAPLAPAPPVQASRSAATITKLGT